MVQPSFPPYLRHWNSSASRPRALTDCTIDGCENGGTCTDNNNNGLLCACATGWSGTRCEIDTDECSDYSPCDTHLTCANTPGSYTCVTTTTTTDLAFVKTDSPVTNECSNFIDLMNDATIISDSDIIIQYQEIRTTADDLFNDVKKRLIPSVAMETFTIDFPDEPEFWIGKLDIVVEEDVKVDVILMTSQLCTNQSNKSRADVSRNVNMSNDFYASAHFQNFDLSTFMGQESMACVSQLIIKTKRTIVVADDSTFEVETKIKGCTLLSGELIADCKSHDLFTDLPPFSTYVQWKPTPAAQQTLRPDGDGLILHRLMYPSITINKPIVVQSVRLIGDILSATIIAANNSYYGLNEDQYPFMDVNFYPNRQVTTSTLKVTTLMPDLTSSPDGYFRMQMEVIGCPITAQSTTTPANTTPTDAIETTSETTTDIAETTNETSTDTFEPTSEPNTDTVETIDETTLTPPPQKHNSTAAPPSSDYFQTTDEHISTRTPSTPSSKPKTSDQTSSVTLTKPTSLTTQRPPKVVTSGGGYVGVGPPETRWVQPHTSGAGQILLLQNHISWKMRAGPL